MTPFIEAAFGATLQRISSPGWRADFATPKPVVGPDFDDLAELPPPDAWSDVHHKLFGALRRIAPRQKLAVLTMMCNDAPYIAEFIAHYLGLGAERIFIYTNNNTDSSLKILQWFEANGLVTLLPMETDGGIHIQRKNYHHALFLLPELRQFEWVAVVDSDEFLLPHARHEHHLPTMLNAAPADAEAIIFPWHWRVGEVTFAPTPGLLAERYAHANQWDHGKSVMRLRNVSSLHNLHYPLFIGDFPLHDTMFNRIMKSAERPDRNCSGGGGWTEHFWTKSFAEFLIKKRRGEIPELNGELAFMRPYAKYFEFCQPPTPENFSPWPDTMLARTKEWLARFAMRPGYAALQAKWQADLAEHTAAAAADPEMQKMFAEMKARFGR